MDNGAKVFVCLLLSDPRLFVSRESSRIDRDGLLFMNHA